MVTHIGSCLCDVGRQSTGQSRNINSVNKPSVDLC
jgi:hypothetical protein